MNAFLKMMPVLCFVSACTMPNESFDCPAKGGVGCRSVSEVNDLINQKRLGDTTQDIDQASLDLGSRQVKKDIMAGYRVWMAPYTDDEGALIPSHVDML